MSWEDSPDYGSGHSTPADKRALQVIGLCTLYVLSMVGAGVFVAYKVHFGF